MLTLADMKDMTETEIKAHIADNYYDDANSEYSYCRKTDSAVAAKAKELEDYDFLVAYEEGDGYESSSWFLLRHRSSGALGTISGSHCSCYGYEGQGEIESVDIIYLQSKNFHLPIYTRGEEGERDKQAVMDLINRLYVLPLEDLV